jgi:UDP-4-amino-4,6-dideoxy-N-acetyl-beta-L-altrosamine transaminase
MIPYARQDINEDDIAAVVEVLRSEHLTQGSKVPLFEKAVADYCGSKFGVAANSATSALHMACLALGLGPGRSMWTSPNTFVASANCAVYCGAQIDFVDIDPNTYNMCPNRLEEKLMRAEKDGSLPHVVIPVHYAGQSCDMPRMFELSKRFGFRIIEDASHAIGASYSDSKVGATRYSDITVFSFHPVKIITTGEGGMAMTNDEDLANRLRRCRAHGITVDPKFMESRSEDEVWNYQQIEIGFNYRMTELQAALGICQLGRIDRFVDRRHEIANRYFNELAPIPIKLPWQHPRARSSFHLYPVRLPPGRSMNTQRVVYEKLRANGVGVNLHYIPVHRQPFYSSMGFREGYCPQAELHHRQAITLPMYPTMTDDQQSEVIEKVRAALL